MTKEDQLKRDRARGAVRRAIDRGQLVRPSSCLECGQVPKRAKDGRSLIHAHHHNGYSHPLDIIWLCINCHFKHDDRTGGEKNGRAKITMKIAQEIRKRFQKGKNRYACLNSGNALGREFGIDGTTVMLIVKNKLWIDAALSE